MKYLIIIVLPLILVLSCNYESQLQTTQKEFNDIIANEDAGLRILLRNKVEKRDLQLEYVFINDTDNKYLISTSNIRDGDCFLEFYRNRDYIPFIRKYKSFNFLSLKIQLLIRMISY